MKNLHKSIIVVLMYIGLFFGVKTSVVMAYDVFFELGQSFPLDKNTATTAADFTNDGYTDIFFIGERGGALGGRIFINDGSGNMILGQFYGIGETTGVINGDFNNDGWIDILINHKQTVPDEVWLNDGTGSFFKSDIELSLGYTKVVKYEDINSDGLPDFFYCSKGSDTLPNNDPLSIWMNNGDGSYTEVIYNFDLDYCQAMDLGDVDNDGDIDIQLVGNAFTDGANMYLNDGLGNFSLSQYINVAADVIATKDFNGDGFLDVYFGNSLGYSTPDKLFLGNGNGTFTGTDQLIARSQLTQKMGVSDFDLDGDLDVLAVANWGKVILLENDGNGFFTEPGIIIESSYIYDTATADFNNDGYTDFVIANNSSKIYFTKLLVQDIDSDGITDDIDNSELFNPDQSDLDGDGVGDVSDPCPTMADDSCDMDYSAGISIGPDGGVLLTPNNAISVDIPVNTLDTHTSISITGIGTNYELITNKGNTSAVFGFELQPSGIAFNVPVTLTLTWLDDDNDGFIDTTGDKEKNLFIFKDGVAVTDKCSKEPGCDQLANTFTIQITGFSEWIIGTPINTAPIADISGPNVVNEGQVAEFDASGSQDYENNIIEYSWDLDNDGEFDDSNDVMVGVTYYDDGDYIVGLQITDEYDEQNTAYLDINVVNVVPNLSEISSTNDPVSIGTEVTASAIFTDPGADTWMAIWDWGDENSSGGIIDADNVQGSHVYNTPGVYTIALSVTDDDGGVGFSSFQYIVIYNPEGGFVTGGGWIDSPVGAYTMEPTLTGKVTFGFVSRYKNNDPLPSGNTEFQFKMADFNFKATSYEWLVISSESAIYKGAGTINGEGDYRFMVSVIDGDQQGGDGFDKFRIKIWNPSNEEIIYDNQIGASEDSDPITILGGGSIGIHSN